MFANVFTCIQSLYFFKDLSILCLQSSTIFIFGANTKAMLKEVEAAYAQGEITEEDLDLTWGDVNGDGMVNARDARLILKLSAELIEHFPVCNLSEE